VKPFPKALQLQLIDTLQNQLIPWAGSGASIAFLDAPPRVIGQNTIAEQPGKALPTLQGVGQVVRMRHWRSEYLNSVEVPTLTCVIEGEADLEMGITQQQCQRLGIEGKRWIIGMPKSTFFLATPGTPTSAAGKVHWRRPYPEKAYSRMLWMQIHETGAYCHFNTSDKGKLWISPHLFLHSPHISALTHNLIQEMRLESPRHVSITYFYLGLILEYLLQSLLLPPQSDLTPLGESGETLLPLPPNNLQNADERMRTILAYIDEHLANPNLSTENIAAKFHLSPVHLRRLFHKAVAMSPMKFITLRRLEFSRQLLLESSFNIKQISRYCGYKHSSNFSNAFLQRYGVSPSSLRQTPTDAP
jgi:AraC-like DNA-binding protein